MSREWGDRVECGCLQKWWGNRKHDTVIHVCVCVCAFGFVTFGRSEYTMKSGVAIGPMAARTAFLSELRVWRVKKYQLSRHGERHRRTRVYSLTLLVLDLAQILLLGLHNIRFLLPWARGGSQLPLTQTPGGRQLTRFQFQQCRYGGLMDWLRHPRGQWSNNTHRSRGELRHLWSSTQDRDGCTH